MNEIPKLMAFEIIEEIRDSISLVISGLHNISQRFIVF